MFRLCDNNRSGTLSRLEFAEGLRDYGCSLSKDDMRVLFDHFDTDGNGSVNYNEFLLHLRVSHRVASRVSHRVASRVSHRVTSREVHRIQ